MDFAGKGEGAHVNRLQNAMDAGDIAWWEMDVSGGKVHFHDRKAEMLGYDPDNFGHYEDFTDLLHPDDYEQAMQAMKSHLEGKAEMYDVEYRIEAYDGSYQWIHDVGGITERNDDGSPKLVSGLVVNISSQKEREQQLRREKDRLDEFASVVSHDLRNPLNIAQGRIELAREESSSEHLEEAADALERSLDLIDDMLTLAKAGEQTGEIESVDLSNFAHMCWGQVEKSEATIQTDLDLTVRADRSRLQQLFENLFRNAVENGGETVTINVGALPDGFYVEDDGPGIPEAKRPEVFESGISTREEGTGFGLSIVKQIVQAHDWEIRVTEGEKGGARFEISGVESVAK